MKKYAIHTGIVRSQWDNDMHFISFQELCRLYGVDPLDCIDWNKNSPGYLWNDYLHLYPRHDGKYDLEELE